MNDLNTVTISGNLVRDPEYFGQDGSVCRFSMAVNRSFQTKAQQGTSDYTDEVCYVDVTAFNGLAKRMRKLHGPNRDAGIRADRLVVTGRLELNRWDAEDGTKRQQLRVIATDASAEGFFRPATQPLSESEQAVAAPAEAPVAAGAVAEGDDIPF